MWTRAAQAADQFQGFGGLAGGKRARGGLVMSDEEADNPSGDLYRIKVCTHSQRHCKRCCEQHWQQH